MTGTSQPAPGGAYISRAAGRSRSFRSAVSLEQAVWECTSGKSWSCRQRRAISIESVGNRLDMSSLPGGDGNTSSNPDSSQDGHSRKRRKSKTKRAELAAKDSEEIARVALEEAQRALTAASDRREKATAARKRAKEQSKTQKAANAVAQTPTPAESGAEAMEVETPDPTPAKPKKGKVAEKSATTPSKVAEDKLAASATPPVGIKIPKKVVPPRATESTQAPTSATEPSVTEPTAIEPTGARPKEVPGAEDQQAWEVVTRRVRARRALPDERPLRTLKSYKTGKQGDAAASVQSRQFRRRGVV